MRKMTCLFEKDLVSLLAGPVMRPENAWVADTGVIATRKWDGTACAVFGGVLFARFDAKRSPPPPDSFRCAPEIPMGQYGCNVHWTPATGGVGRGQYRWHHEAWAALPAPLPDGTYELVGPRVNGNPEHLDVHQFRRHGDIVFHDAPRDFDGLKAYLARLDAEGIVFHHPDGRMCKLRRRDFGFRWPC